MYFIIIYGILWEKIQKAILNYYSTKTVAQIAKQIHEAEEPKLIHRLYLFGQYNAVTNLWEDLDPIVSLIDWDTNARIVDVCQILKSDIATIPLAALLPANNPLTARNELEQATFDMTNMLTPQFTLNGKRSSDRIKICALSALVRLQVERAHDSNSVYTDKVKFRFGFYKWTKITATGELDNTLPNIKSLVKWQPFGYSAQLDNQITAAHAPQGQGMPYATENLNMIMNSERCRTLVEKEVTLHVSSIKGAVNEKIVRIYKKIDMEDLHYVPNNVTGEETLNYKVFFAIRADTPNYITGDIGPRCFACVKNYYQNVQ